MDDERRVTQISTTDGLIRAGMLHSRNIPGCPRPDCGSYSYYAWVAVVEKLQRDGVDFTKIDPIYTTHKANK